MTLKACYEAIGGDYEGVVSRLVTEARVNKFLTMFLHDTNYSSHNLTEALRLRKFDENADKYFDDVRRDYGETISAIRSMQAENTGTN